MAEESTADSGMGVCRPALSTLHLASQRSHHRLPGRVVATRPCKSSSAGPEPTLTKARRER
ncbi:MAG: hypothetical protein AVDCRST_MAG72-2618 [uncultured Nocardioidaceae bacterium]|uniref:Uncharacterized protein n=1 Tax=uncultured Nocardioidaceae bacterium TaxID=253824 RepID=A0A6J4MP82_9ACTN|nr:MAG: hypothetical protein AVDCRST_MAG72-2618 [uncultured Nocardioidaceae bacterium]